MSNAAAVLPLTCFLLMFVLRRRAVRRVSEHTDDTRASVIDACVLWGSAVVAITELLSLARAVGHRPLLATWAIFALALAAWALFGGRGEIDRGCRQSTSIQWTYRDLSIHRRRNPPVLLAAGGPIQRIPDCSFCRWSV